MEKQLKHISKLMSLVLRHQPEAIGLTLDENGWASVEELITKMKAAGTGTDRETIEMVVATNDKKRFNFNEDKSLVRANQGHSIEVELQLDKQIPPHVLYHGTAEKFVASILKDGLKKQQRQHVHLSLNRDTAKAVGSRHGKPVILNINARAMHNDGYEFYLSANNVWLTDTVPVQYLST